MMKYVPVIDGRIKCPVDDKEHPLAYCMGPHFDPTMACFLFLGLDYTNTPVDTQRVRCAKGLWD
jgi:hypothetical protein